MPYNILNKKAWLAEIDQLSDKYIGFIEKLGKTENEIELDLVLSKKYKSRELVFTGQEIVDEVRKKLSRDTEHIYEFRTVDNRPLVKIRYRVSFDDDQKEAVSTKEDENMIVTLEDLKAKHVEVVLEIGELKGELKKKEADNFDMFKDLLEAVGGLYQYVSNKKLILTLSKILKEYNFYDSEKGTKYSYEDLSKKNKEKVITNLFKKIYK